MDDIRDVEIDAAGRFKYILLQLIDKRSGTDKLIVRGFGRCEFHGDIFDEVEPEVAKKGLKLKCLGGGKIIHDSAGKSIQIFGYSQGYGQADHAKTAEILKKAYPDYKLSCSNEGY